MIPGECRQWLRSVLLATIICTAQLAHAESTPSSESTGESASDDAKQKTNAEGTLFGSPVDRGGFHFQVAFGIGGGPDSLGLFHAMEIGGTFSNGWTLALLHTFIQNKGILGQHGGPDLFGGWMAQLKIPIVFPELVGKVATGPGGTHDQSDGIKLNGGWGVSYGVDLHLPFFETSGMTLGASFLHVMAEDSHFFGSAFSVGYTFF